MNQRQRYTTQPVDRYYTCTLANIRGRGYRPGAAPIHGGRFISRTVAVLFFQALYGDLIYVSPLR